MYDPEHHVAIIGGGPAGLTAAYLLAQEGWRVSVFEGDGDSLGGMSRTYTYKGFRLDIGGHPFETRSNEVASFWSSILRGDLVERPRLSRLCYKGQIFPYPRSAADVLPKLGLQEAVRSGLSYLQTKLRAAQQPKSFEEWGCSQFGSRLFGLLFQSYADKSWEGAAEPSRETSPMFRYPRLGPGQMWERCADEIRQLGGAIHLGTHVMALEQTFDRMWTISLSNHKGREMQVRAEQVISTTDIRELVHMIQPAVSAEVALAGSSLQYKDFLTVALILRDFRGLPDQTLHLYDPELKAAKLQNYKAWSPEMVPDAAYACYGLEYFRPKEDQLWDLDDRELLALAAAELEKTGLARASEVEDGCVIRVEKACPIYDKAYANHIQAIRKGLASRYPALHLAGRNGMHKAHQLDQAMLTAIHTANNIIEGSNRFDVWAVNPGGELHYRRPQTTAAGPAPVAAPRAEAAATTASSSGLRLVSKRIPTSEQLANLGRNVSQFRGPSVAGMFKVHNGGASGKHRNTVPQTPPQSDHDGDSDKPPPSAA